MSNTKEKETSPIAEEEGVLSVNTESLFPIIKKWLYSEEDIFVRELISNAYDAIRKLEHLEDVGEFKGNVGNPKIDLAIDAKTKTLSFADNGIGMDAEEVKKYINQIAFSGAKEFMEKYEKSDGIIGNFGLGFFSAFMVSSSVEIETLSSKQGAQPVFWRCDGSTSFKMKVGNKKEIGTTVRLFLDADHEKMLDESYVINQVKRFSNFLPVEISVNGKAANEQNPLWQKKANALTDEDYKTFYSKLFPSDGEPLVHIHIDTDFPFRLKGILYFPKAISEFDFNQKDKIKLFCNNVFVSDNVEGILPGYLNLLHGVLDSPDIPLNVSRSALQNDTRVKKIAAHIVKKVTDKLAENFKKDRKNFEAQWPALAEVVKVASVSDNEFLKKSESYLLFEKIAKSSEKVWVTLKEYKEANSALKDRVVYSSDASSQVAYVEKMAEKNCDVLLLANRIDGHFMQSMEMAFSPLRFFRVDSGTPEEIISGDEEKKDDKLVEKFSGALNFFKTSYFKNENMKVEVKEFSDADTPAIRVEDEQLRRMQDMSKMMGGNTTMFPSTDKLLLNSKNKLVLRLNSLQQLSEKEKTENLGTAKALARSVDDFSLLQQGKLNGKSLSSFLKRISTLMEKSLDAGVFPSESVTAEEIENAKKSEPAKASNPEVVSNRAATDEKSTDNEAKKKNSSNEKA